MALPTALQRMRQHPAMCGVSTFSEAVAFVAGYDAALGGEFLDGFREWLILTLDEGDSLAWPYLIRRLHHKIAKRNEQDAALIDFLMANLEAFVGVRGSPDQFARLQARYRARLAGQNRLPPTEYRGD